jgi:hypothetical protein
MISTLGMSMLWPTDWQGQTHLDCGSEGQLLTLVSTTSQPNGTHQKSFQAIASRWSQVWPAFRASIAELMKTCGKDQPDWSSVQTIYLELADEPLAEDAEWSIGVVFSDSATMWVLPYRGWVALREQAQAIW